MGRKAKLKKQRREGKTTSSEQAQPKNFIKRVEKEGYRLDKITRSPEVPRNDVEPQV